MSVTMPYSLQIDDNLLTVQQQENVKVLKVTL